MHEMTKEKLFLEILFTSIFQPIDDSKMSRRLRLSKYGLAYLFPILQILKSLMQLKKNPQTSSDTNKNK